MDDPQIQRLYQNVISAKIFENQIKEEEVIRGIISMKEVYKPQHSDINAARSSVADYNDPAHRCAYLHKYAAFHTMMVQEFFSKVVHTNYRLFYEQVHSQQPYSICCLGGGPGNDAIAVLSALHRTFSYVPAKVTVVDYMKEWEFTFNSTMKELNTGRYGSFGNNTSHFLNWRYLGANLLKSLDPEVKYSISNANLVTMVKFASATSCKNTEDMIQNIIHLVKPGAILFFIDNASGGYGEMVTEAAVKYQFVPLYGPLKHEEYLNFEAKIKRFGFYSCHKSTVSFQVWLRPLPYGKTLHQLSFPQFSNAILGPSPPRNMYAGSPLTPFVYVAGSQDQVAQSEGVSGLHGVQSIPSYLSTPQNANIINSPLVSGTPTPRCNRKSKAGCLPLKRWRRHISTRIQNVKSRAANFVRQTKRKHPVFRL